jgi:hypothetical protein
MCALIPTPERTIMIWKAVFAAIILAAPVLLWFFVIRPRLNGRIADIGADLESWWERLKARLYAFRTFIVGAIGYYASEIPGALQSFNVLDVSWMTPEVRFYIGLATIVAMMLVRAYSTTPISAPADTREGDHA